MKTIAFPAVHAAFALALQWTHASAATSGGAAAPAPASDLLGHWSFESDFSSSVGGWTGEQQGGAKVGQPDGVVGGGCYRNGEGEGFLQTDLLSLNQRTAQTVLIPRAASMGNRALNSALKRLLVLFCDMFWLAGFSNPKTFST